MLIYKITNKINNKIYIGQTVGLLRVRWSNHKKLSKHSDLGKKHYIHKAIQKYGIENFTIEEIDGANSLSELNYLEKHYICKFNSLAPNGYNLDRGGKNGRRHKDIVDKCISKRYKNLGGTGCRKIVCISTGEIFNNVREAASKLNILSTNISCALRGKTDKANGMIFRYLDDNLNKKFDKLRETRHRNMVENSKKLGKSVICINNNTEYYSIQEAARQLKLSAGNIHQILNGKRKQTKGYIFKFKE